MTLVARQFLHLSLSLDALMYGLVVLIMIPLTTNNLDTMLLLISLSFLGN